MKFRITKERFGIEYASVDFESQDKYSAFKDFKEEVSNTNFSKGLKMFLVQPVKSSVMSNEDIPLAFAKSKDTVGVYDEDLMEANESFKRSSDQKMFKSIVEALSKPKISFSKEEAKEVGDQLKVDWNKVDLDQFHKGMNVEVEHGKVDKETNVTDDNKIKTAKVALAHLKEVPDYYTKLKKVEK